MYYVCILLLKNKDLYKGSTSDLRLRLQDHQKGKVASTRNFRPLKLIHYEGYILKSDAERRERFLKTTEGRRLLRQQIRDILEKINNKPVD
jgi:putative endonuclease